MKITALHQIMLESPHSSSHRPP